MQVGFIGLGIMGSRMAANLQKQGHMLVVHNRTRAKAEPLVAGGARWADSSAAVAEQAPLVFTMLSTPDIVRQVAIGPDGFLDHLQPNSLWVDSSTVSPSFSQEMALEAQKRGMRFIDAPVVGSRGPAEQAQLLFLLGGEPDDVQACKPLWSAMGRQFVHVGGHGAGSSMKMLFALLLGEAMVAFSEAILLGESLGIPRDLLFQTLLGAPVTAPFVSAKRAKIEAGNFSADFPLRWLHKDLQLVSATAYEQRVALPAENLVKELYGLASRTGWAEQDFSAVYAFLQAKSEGA